MTDARTNDERLTLDQRRLVSLARIMDGIGDINFNETAAKMAVIFGHPEPTAADYYRAVCVGIDSLPALSQSHE